MSEREIVRLLRPKTVANRLGISLSGVWLLVKNGKLKPPYKPLAIRASVWLESEIEDFIFDQIGKYSRAPEHRQR